MPPKINALGLNPLQRRTLVLLQVLSKDPDCGTKDEATGDVIITRFPYAHGNHFHVGDAVVATADATGLTNEAVWKALERKGLAKSEFPNGIRLTPAGLDYNTGIADQVLQRPDGVHGH